MAIYSDSEEKRNSELQIDVELKAAAASVESCRDLLNKLEDRLSRVLIARPADVSKGEDRDLVPLAAQIANINAIQRDNNVRIQLFIERLQL